MFEKMYFLFEKPIELSFQLYALIEITIFLKKLNRFFNIWVFTVQRSIVRLLQ